MLVNRIKGIPPEFLFVIVRIAFVMSDIWGSLLLQLVDMLKYCLDRQQKNMSKTNPVVASNT